MHKPRRLTLRRAYMQRLHAGLNGVLQTAEWGSIDRPSDSTFLPPSRGDRYTMGDRDVLSNRYVLAASRACKFSLGYSRSSGQWPTSGLNLLATVCSGRDWGGGASRSAAQVSPTPTPQRR